jgi:hypothetical protein
MKKCVDIERQNMETTLKERERERGIFTDGALAMLGPCFSEDRKESIVSKYLGTANIEVKAAHLRNMFAGTLKHLFLALDRNKQFTGTCANFSSRTISWDAFLTAYLPAEKELGITFLNTFYNMYNKYTSFLRT